MWKCTEYSRYYLLVGRLCDSLNGTDTKSKVESESAPPPCVVPNCWFYFSAHWSKALTAKFKNPTLEKVNPAPTTGGRGLEALSNFSIFRFDFTSYQFVTPPAVLRAYEIASEWWPSTSGSEPCSDLASEVQNKILIAGQLSELIRKVRSLQNLNVGVWAMRGAKLCTSRIALSVSC